MDTTAIGQAAAALMEAVAEEFGEYAEIEAALVIVDVTHGADRDFTAVRYGSRNGGCEPLSCAHSAGLASIALAQLQTPVESDDA